MLHYASLGHTTGDWMEPTTTETSSEHRVRSNKTRSQLCAHSSFFLLPLLILLNGCTPPQLHSVAERELTAGVVQKEIRKGMFQSDVAAALGSPNIVSRDSSGKESWIYDRIATEVSYRQSGSSVGVGSLGGNARGDSLLIGVLGGSFGTASGGSATSQKTLTVIIKFDENSRVDQFSYHQSRF